MKPTGIWVAQHSALSGVVATLCSNSNLGRDDVLRQSTKSPRFRQISGKGPAQNSYERYLQNK